MKQSDLKYFYQISDVFLLPTKYEIFGMVLLEALYFHVPVVTTNNGGSDFLIEDDNYKLAFNVEEWYLSIKKIFDGGYFPFKKDYSWDDIVDKFIEIYQK